MVAIVVNLIWSGNADGFERGLREAEGTESRGDVTGANAQRASVFYSYSRPGDPFNVVHAFWNFVMARRYARKVAEVGEAHLSASQCDIAGTVLARSWLWLRADVERARKLYISGLAIADVVPHDRALLFLGLAEVERLRGKSIAMNLYPEALHLVSAILIEDDQVMAKRQLVRICRRAAVLGYRLGFERGPYSWMRCYFLARKYALLDQDLNVRKRTATNAKKEMWNLLHPLWWHRFLPH